MTKRVADDRRVQRAEVVAAVECEARGRSQRAIAFDLSTKGCLLQCSLMFVDVGDTIALRFPGGLTLQGEVQWRRGLNSGVQFAGSFPSAAIQQYAVPILTPPSVLRPHRPTRSPSEMAVQSLTRPFDPPPGKGGRGYRQVSILSR